VTTWTNQGWGRNLLQDDVKSSDTIFHVEGCLREKLCGYFLRCLCSYFWKCEKL
jgi:hypothetical protein